jgi:hypothetical protein
MSEVDPKQLTELKEQIAALSVKLEQAKLVVKQWSEASSRLSQSAAEARAKNQGMGRGIGGALLGSKYRASIRSATAGSNAAIAQDVAKKRAKILEEKMKAQDLVRRIQVALKSAKERQKSLVALAKTQNKTKETVIKTKTESITLLQKLKEAYDLGLLTEQEYDQKRKKLISDL